MDRRDFLKGGTAALALIMFGAFAGKRVGVPIILRMDVMPSYSHCLRVSARYRAGGKVFQYANLYDEWDVDDFGNIKSQFEDAVRYAMNRNFRITDLDFKWKDQA